MTREEKIQYWVDLSNNDFTVAETLIKNGHNLYAGFMCHQANERTQSIFEQTKELLQWIKEKI